VITVSNTGPIIALSKIKQLSLLKSIFGVVLVPPVVAREVFAKLASYK
jgi:predicted nucleic acid-binding protein